MLELTTNLLADIGGWPALKEARALVERKRISHLRREGGVIRAKVHGAEKIYEAQIILADRISNVEVRCTCAESRRRVCPHILATGLAAMGGNKAHGVDKSEGETAVQRAATTTAPSPGGRRLPRWPLGDAPAGTPSLEITVLLPLQLKEGLGKDPVRIILETRRSPGEPTQPWDAVISHLQNGFALSEEDDRLLSALENTTGTVTGINSVPRAKIGTVLHALRNHPRVWIGKKQRIEVHALEGRPAITFSTGEDGALELSAGSRPPLGTAAATSESLPIAGWSFDGDKLTEAAALPAGFSSSSRVIPVEKIPDFLSKELPALERACEITFAPGFAEFQMELGQPSLEARLEGALSRLTLDLIARYGDKEFVLFGKTEPSAYQRYFPDSRTPNRFWRRNVLVEREALAQAESAGFTLVRNGATTFSLPQEKQVARFLANVLPRWKRNWTVIFGSRLELTMRDIDIAEPEFSLKSSSGEDWLSLDLKLSVGGQPVALDQAEIQRWLQTGQTHARTANKRVLLIPTEAWGEMREVLAECEVEQDQGSIRVEKTFAPFLAGALSAQGFRSLQNVSAEWPKPEVAAVLDSALAEQLRPYQLQGVEWMASLAQQKLHGLLADDMGLGKTLQALAFAAWLKVGADRSDAEGTVARSATATTEGRHDGHRPPLQGELSHEVQGLTVARNATATSEGRHDGHRPLLQGEPSHGVQGLTAARSATVTTEGRHDGHRPPLQGEPSHGVQGLTVARSATATTEGRHDGHRPPLQGEPSHGVQGLTVARSATATTEGRRDGPRPPLQGEPSHGVQGLTVARSATATTEGRRDGPRPSLQLKGATATLVVCPTSLVANWLREAARFTPHLRALDLTGADRAEKFAKRGEFDLLVTSYAILRRDIEQYRMDEFSLVILDEAQHIKNRGSQNAQSAKALRARYRLILSGTPLENSVLDLWSLYDFLLPGYLGTAQEFREKYETPLAKGTPDPKTMERLRHRMRPFFLRRTKEEVLTELPPKLEHLTLCELSDEQREVYKAVLAQGRREVFENSGKQGKGRDRIAVLTTLLRLRQVCCHLDLLPKGKADDGHRPPLQGSAELSAARWKEPSAKMERTFELIEEAIDGGHRVLLFSQFVQMLHLLRDEAKRREMPFCYLDGQTVERQAEVDRFQNSPDVPIFFISLKAGGTGLNLTGADTVIHFDPWWNPAVEEQATSRAHRMGQSRSVQAYKLIAAGTVEEKIQALQARKRELFEASLGGDAAFVEKLTGEDLEELLAE